jgi:hypothetical protein
MAYKTQLNQVIELGVAQRQPDDGLLRDAVTALVQEAARRRLMDIGTFSVAQSFTGTGNGVLTLGVPAYGGDVRPGAYLVTCTAIAANSGTFSVADPEGNIIGTVSGVGIAFDGEVKFTIADGSTDFALNDRFTLTVTAAAEAKLVDSSTGVATASLVAVVTPTNGTVDGVTAFSPKAAFDTAITKVQDAHEEIGQSLRTLIAIVAGSTYPLPNAITGATAADLTIAALDKVLTAGVANCVPATTAITQIVNARNNQATLCSALNFLRVAVGLAPITDGSGGVVSRSQTAWTLSSKATTAAATSVNGDLTLTDATTDAALTALANNIATLAAKLNEVLSNLRIGPFVVATNSARNRMVLADVTV